MLSIYIGHFIPALELVLAGHFTEVTASGTIRFPEANFIDAMGKPTGEVSHSTVHDQISLSGIIQSGNEGVFVNFHGRGGLASTGERGKGRRTFQWIIDGEDGTIEVTDREADGVWSAFVAITEKDVFLNGQKVELEVKSEDQLGNSGKAWLEFAKGKEGKYLTMDDAVRCHQVVEAALESITEGKRIML